MRTNHRGLIFLLAALTLVTSAMLTYWPGLSGGFIFDDFPNLVRQPAWKIERFDLEHLGRALQGGITGNVGRPLAILSFAVNYYFTGLDPFWLKLTSILMHAGNAMLVFLLCRRLVRLVPAGPRPTGDIFVPALLASAWLVHPLQTSTVLYVVQRMEIGAATGILLALLAYVHARVRQIEGRRAWPWLVAACLAMLFGLGFKESALLVPGFAFLIEVCILRFGSSGQRRRDTTWIIFYLVGFVLALSAYVVLMLPWPDLVARFGTRSFGPLERLMTQAPVLVMYLKQILLPLPEGMYFYYDNIPVSRGLLEARTFLSFTLLLGLGAVAVMSRRHWPLICLGIGWFFVAHALTSNLVPLELAFEHRNYLALLGVLLALVQPLCALGRRLHRDARTTLAIVPVVALATLCWVQASTWGAPMRLAWTLENRNPTSPRASYGLAEQLLVASGEDPNSAQWALAKQQFRHAANLPGDPSLALHGLIMMHARLGLTLEPTLWLEFRSALTAGPLTPERATALHAVSECRISGHCIVDDHDLLETLLTVLQRNPHNTTAHTLYANFAWNVIGDQTLAVSLQTRAVQLTPRDPQMRENLEKFLLASDQIDPRIRAYAIEILDQPGFGQKITKHDGSGKRAE